MGKHEIWKAKNNVGTCQWKKTKGDRFGNTYRDYQYNTEEPADTGGGSNDPGGQEWARADDKIPELANTTVHDPVYSLSTAKSQKFHIYSNALKGQVDESRLGYLDQIDSCDKLIRDQKRKERGVKGYVSFGKMGHGQSKGDWVREQGLPHEYPCQGRFAGAPDTKPTTNTKKAPFISKSEPRLASISAHLARLPAFPQHRESAVRPNPSNNAATNIADRPRIRPHPLNSQRYLD
jgi:hypothetical protein